MKDEIQTVKKYLRSKGFKVTPQRESIVETIFATHAHFSADDLFDMMREDGSQVSKATIYRTLSLLTEGGFLETLRIGEDQKYYEHVLGHEHHDHLICLGCQKIVEFYDQKIEDRQELIIEKHGFVAVRHTHRIYGYCPECQKQKPNEIVETHGAVGD
ncbi:MAG: Fur family transcriptional regulator [Planctomycetota bacterium]